MSPGGGEHAVIINLALSLAQHVKLHNLGRVNEAETGFKPESDPDTVLTDRR
jgi:hypothetical protein